MAVGSSLIANWDTVGKVKETIANSAGSADAELQTVQNSLSHRLNALKETWTGLWQDLFPRDALGTAIDGLTFFSEIITGLIKNLGLLGTALTGVGIVQFAKNFGRPKLFGLIN